MIYSPVKLLLRLAKQFTTAKGRSEGVDDFNFID